jgi:putative Holliday junction resolvase
VLRSGCDADVLLAFDFGRRRIGVATANLHTRTAAPLTTLHVRGAELPWPDLDALIAEWRPEKLIVGVPGTGSEGAAAVSAQIQAFVAALLERYGITVETIDEAFTSTDASAELRRGRRSGLLRRRIRKDSIDRYAACHIAERWLAAGDRDS